MDLFDGLSSTTERFTYRYYQRDAIDAAVKFFREDNNVAGHAIMVEPTAAGKSLIIAGTIDELDEPIMVFQPSPEILMQNHDKLRRYGYLPAIFSASLKRKNVGKITLATIGSVHNAPQRFKGFKHIIIDECHRVDPKTKTEYTMGRPIVSGGMYWTLINGLHQIHGDDLKVLGLTATPYRLHSTREYGAENRFITRTNPKIFKRVIHHTQPAELLKEGYLSQMKYYTIPGFTREGIRMNSSGSDFNDRALLERYHQIGFGNMVYDTVRGLQKLCKSILVFTKFVMEAEALADRLPRCAVVSEKTNPAKRERIFKSFLSGETQVLANVGVATTGFDFPGLEAVVTARPTLSLALWTQMIGRGARIAEGKDHCKIVDMCENLPLFGKMEDMKLMCRSHGMWYIESNGREITNKPYGLR